LEAHRQATLKAHRQPTLIAHRPDDVPTLLRILQAIGLLINAAECIFGVISDEFLDHLVAASSIFLLTGRVVAVRRFPCPINILLTILIFYRYRASDDNTVLEFTKGR
jgi:hypothetical protein